MANPWLAIEIPFFQLENLIFQWSEFIHLLLLLLLNESSGCKSMLEKHVNKSEERVSRNLFRLTTTCLYDNAFIFSPVLRILWTIHAGKSRKTFPESKYLMKERKRYKE